MKPFTPQDPNTLAARCRASLAQKSAALALALALMLSLGGCSSTTVQEIDTSSSLSAQERLEALLTRDDDVQDADDSSAQNSMSSSTADTNDSTSASNDSDSTSTTLTNFTADDIPAYTGELSIAINNNIPFFTQDELTTDSFESYANLDFLGRCGTAIACIGQNIMPTEDRESISSVTPTGWVQATYDTSVVPGGYLYNRSHLIGFQLTGENANAENLITGTQSFNVSGMLPYENMVADYVQETGNHVYYRVTPIFDGTDLLAQGVLIEAVSVEDGGAGIQFNVFCYNVQDGIYLNYATGESYQMALLSEHSSASATPTPAPTTSVSEALLASYVLNISSKKIHMPDCHYVNSMNEENKLYTTESLAILHSQGYEDCKVCNPE